MIKSVVNLQTMAYENLRDKIIKTEFIPGQKIGQKELETTLGIGRTPVREAIIRLTREGLLDVIPQSGTYVSKIDLYTVVNARFIRENIERPIIAESSAKITEKKICEFKEIIHLQKLYSSTHDYEKFFSVDDQFHHLFYSLCDKENVWNWLQIINLQLNRFRWLRLKIDDLKWDTLIGQHEAILAATSNHDAKKATYLVEKHLHLMLDEKEILLEHFPNYFTENGHQS